MMDIVTKLLGPSSRTEKPRSHGITILLDKGLGPNAIDDIGTVCGAHCDYAKIAWGSLLISGGLEAKIAAYRRHGIEPKIGGTLFEYAYANDKVEDLLVLVQELKIHVEISDGVIKLPRRERLALISKFAARVNVFSELGGKLSAQDLDFVAAAKEDLAAGAKKVVIEGREVGPVGKPIRTDLVDRLLDALPVEDMVFESLERPQQVFFIKRVGANVNLGNILPKDLMTVECFRRGLKEHTFLDKPV